MTPPISNIKKRTTTYQHKITKEIEISKRQSRVTSSTPAPIDCNSIGRVTPMTSLLYY